ncbi:hypothetical protein E4U54_001467 [Claviceps lovelessii]|nr:hypothetical protein E4U54_001467 [Claviceps lovelessii]
MRFILVVFHLRVLSNAAAGLSIGEPELSTRIQHEITAELQDLCSFVNPFVLGLRSYSSWRPPGSASVTRDGAEAVAGSNRPA